MSKAVVRLTLLVIIALFAESARPADPSNTIPPYTSIKDVEDEIHFIHDIWDGDGIVIVGQLKLPDNARIATRIPIYEDGSYCTALYRNRKLLFFSHGYDPLEITQYSQIATNVYDAGTQQFAKSNPENIRALRGVVAAISTSGKVSTIGCALQIRNHAYLWQDHGNRCGSPITVTVDSAKVSSGMPFSFNGLSRLPYVLVLTAPGYIKKELEIGQELNDVIDLGEITLAPALTYRIRYKARVRQNGGKWIGEEDAQSSIISCDGSTEFQFTKQRDGLGNGLELRMRPSENGVMASFFYHQRNSFYDLGQLSANDLPSLDDVDTSNLKGDSDALLQDGHAYYFMIDDINGTGIQMVFRVENE